MRDLVGRVAVVTGAASGIGKSLARRLAAEEMSVVLADVERRALDQAAAEIGVGASGRVIPVVTDVSNAESVEALAGRAFDEFGAVHVLCNNAGVFQGGLLWECTTADFDWTLGVNLWGILHASRSFVPRMLTQGDDAHIVNTVSMAGLATTAYCAPYEVSKFAAAAATECLAHDLASQGAPIRVSLLCPGQRRYRHRPLAPEPPGAVRGRADRRCGVRRGGVGQARRLPARTPDAVAEMVLEAIHDETFLVPTTGSFRRQILDRAEALAERNLPPSASLRLACPSRARASRGTQ